MRLARAGVVFSLGFFALLAQTILFRDALGAFEGSELAIGSFFGSWFLWISLGALLGRLARGGAPSLAPLALLYLPAFALEHGLLISARSLAGVAAYELFPLGRLFFFSLLANAPVSLVTGWLFTLACRRWAQGEAGAPGAGGEAEGAGQAPARPRGGGAAGAAAVARVYVLETLGAAAGGVAGTLLLARGRSGPEVFLVGGVVLAAAVAGAWRARGVRFAPVLLLLGALFSGTGVRWAERDARVAWGRLLPREAYRGRFATAQARYLYGERTGQFLVLSAGGVCEALPDEEHAGEVIALSLAQHPRARRVLVLGPGSLAICRQLLKLPSIESVTWLHPDPEYPKAVRARLPARMRGELARLKVPGTEVREHLRGLSRRYDLAILNLPDATTLVRNRYFTREFLALLELSLTPEGVLAFRVAGGANFLGGELAYLGCSVLATLESLFERVVLKPGEESWFLASHAAALTEAPAVLRDRFASIEGAASLFPPEGLLSLYLPDRIAFQRARYGEAAAAAGGELLVNTDARPKALLYTLLIGLRQAGMRGLGEGVRLFMRGGLAMGAIALLLVVGLRLLYRVRAPSGLARGGGIFEADFLVFAAGFVGISLSIFLMFRYQVRYGSLFLHVGLISALFMVGSFWGGLLGEWARAHNLPLGALLGAHLGLLLLVALVPAELPRAGHAFLFAASGLFTGVYFPLAAGRLVAAGRGAGAAGADLEALDHVGASVGAMLTGGLLLPVLGERPVVLLLAMLVGANLPGALLGGRHARLGGGGGGRLERVLRPAGYGLAGVALFALACAHLAALLRSGKEVERLRAQAHEMMPGAQVEEVAARAAGGKSIRYFHGRDAAEGGEAFVFSSRSLVRRVSGYGGPIVLAVRMNPAGVLEDLRVLASRETPAYLDLVLPWARGLVGRSLLEPEPFRGVDTVSGATLSSAAILGTLPAAARAFAVQALGRSLPGARSQGEVPSGVPGVGAPFLWLAAFLLAAVVLRFRPGRWRRRLFLLAAAALLGVHFNLQYSTQHVFSVLGNALPEARASTAFLLVVGVPALTLLVGNIYCGYVCPFGALQELVGDLRPARLTTDPSKGIWRLGRSVKYVLLFLLVISLARTGDFSVLAADPLTTIFGALRTRATLAVGVGALALSFVFRRFWCRNLCPVGAFLSILGAVRLVRPLSPPARPGRCDLGVRHPRELDCLRCDRCVLAKN